MSLSRSKKLSSAQLRVNVPCMLQVSTPNEPQEQVDSPGGGSTLTEGKQKKKGDKDNF